MLKQCGFSNDLSMLATQIENSRSSRLDLDIEMFFLRNPHFNFSLPNEDFGRMNKDEMRISKEEHFNVVSNQFHDPQTKILSLPNEDFGRIDKR